MKNIYRILGLILAICCFQPVFAQQKKEIIKHDKRIIVPDAIVKTQIIGASNASTEKNVLATEEGSFGVIKYLINNAGFPDALKTEANVILDDMKEGAVIFFRHPMQYQDATLTVKEGVEYSVLHKENDKWSDYLLNTRKIMVVMLDAPEYDPEKRDHDLTKAEFKIEYDSPYFVQTFKDLAKIFANQLGAMGTDQIPNLAVRVVIFEQAKIKPPCRIIISQPSFKENITVKVHEKSHFSFQAGFGGKYVKRQQFSIKDSALVVALDSNDIKDLKGNLMASIVWNPWGVDVDRYSPLWKKQKEHTLCYHLLYRTGLFGGVAISKDPIQNLFAGINFGITKDFYVNAGINWTNQYANSITDIGSITNVDEALKYAERKYTNTFFIGVSFSPGYMLKQLGGKDE